MNERNDEREHRFGGHRGHGGFGGQGGHPHRPGGPGPFGHFGPWGGDDDGGGRGGRNRGGGPGAGGGRMRRGEARFVLLDALRDSPKHGYEIIRALEERSSGQYVPSPGMVYPTMQFLEEMGLVASDQGGERRVFRLTDAGRAELEAHSAQVEAFWNQVSGPAFPAGFQSEIQFLREELDHLRQTVRGGIHPALAREDLATIKAVRQGIERCRNEVREIIASAESAKPKEDVSL